MPFTAEQLREHRAKLRAAGICTSCHTNDARPDKATCQPCQDRIVARRRVRRNEYRAAGRCPECGVETEFSMECDKHRVKRNARRRRLAKRRGDAGLCVECGGDLFGLDASVCGKCNINSRTYKERIIYA